MDNYLNAIVDLTGVHPDVAAVLGLIFALFVAHHIFLCLQYICGRRQ